MIVFLIGFCLFSEVNVSSGESILGTPSLRSPFRICSFRYPDESLPFYCGPGLALETTGYSDSDRTFTRGYPNDVDKEGTNRVDNFHLGWQDREGFRYNPPLNQIGPDRLIEDGYHFSDYVRGIVPTETPENIIYMKMEGAY